MKKLFTLLIAFTLFTSAKAQWVTIPDANFVNWLNNNGFSGAMNGNQMDTTFSLLTTALSIKCNNLSISNLNGIQYFKKLFYLECRYNNLTNFPPLPHSLRIFLCEHNTIITLPNLPDSIQTLYCSNNLLASLPALPSTLFYLNCDNNLLSLLPNLSSSLISLNCSKNQITNLTNLPSHLQTLYCWNNQLTALPILPLTLQNLDCYNNSIQYLPNLPNSLIDINCGNNQILNFPNLPPNIQNLEFANNLVTNLQQLPTTLSSLNCSNNFLNCLPDLKNVNTLLCSNNLLTCLPNYGWNNQLYNSFHTQYSICGLFNNSSCECFWNISGTVYSDKNSSCTFDVADTVLKNIKVELWRNETLEQQTFSRTDGTYTFDVNVFDTFQIKIDTTNISFYLSCPTQQNLTSIISATDSIDVNMNFGMQCKNFVDDISAQNILTSRHRPGRFVNLNIQAGLKSNYGYFCSNQNLSGTVKLFKTGPSKFLNNNSYSIMPNIISDDSLIWNIADFNSFVNSISFNAQVDTQAQIGQSVCYSLIVVPNFTDVNHPNDTLNLCFPIRNGYDPNEKSGRLNIADSTITYTVQFQNTGNDTALHIIVKDTLSNDLDISTLEVLNYSFQPFTQTFGNVAVFNFPNINLVDSTTNEIGSHGFVTFKVKVKSNASASSIQNQAAIYFDFNPPIYTNNLSISTCNYHRTYYSYNQTICNKQFYNFNNRKLSKSGIYYDTLQNYVGCDSTITLQLAVLPTTDTSVVQLNNKLIATALHSGFQWVNCTTDNEIFGATKDTFIANKSGSYAVIVFDSTTYCRDTSNCRSIIVSGIEGQLVAGIGQLVVYPNPASNELICKCANMLINTIEVSNVLGQLVLAVTPSPLVVNPDAIRERAGVRSINVGALPSGIYFIKATDTNGNMMNGKFVKE